MNRDLFTPALCGMCGIVCGIVCGIKSLIYKGCAVCAVSAFTWARAGACAGACAGAHMCMRNHTAHTAHTAHINQINNL